MSITKRLIPALAQIIGGALAGYLAAFVNLHYIIPIFVAGLMVASGAGGTTVWGIGRVFGMRGSFESVVTGAGIGAALGFALLTLGAARDNTTAYAVLALIPATLATVAYQVSSYRAAASSHP